jgi:predicted Fe-S protein YdhL (DUF1289 family)
VTFDEALDQVRALLQQRGRVTYRSLKLRYQFDDELLTGVTDELISAERVAVDEDGKVLGWVGTTLAENQNVATTDAQGEAEACFRKALEVARKQQAKSLELRAVMSLARLWQQQDKKVEARRRLAEIYGWFTEGFDTKDVQEAKALLDELS